MAQEWIKWVKGLTSRREVIIMSSILNLDPRMVAGCLMEVWEWADENVSRNGHARALPMSYIDEISRIKNFASAMEKAEWLQPLPGGGFMFPRWERHNSKSAKQRALAQRRQQRHRETKPSRSKRDKNVTRGEERRGDINNSKPNGLLLDQKPEITQPTLITIEGESVKESGRPRNVLWDKLAAKFYPSGVTERERKHLGVICRDLKIKNATPEEIEARMKRWPALFEGCTLTIDALVKHWDLLGQKSAAAPQLGQWALDKAREQGGTAT